MPARRRMWAVVVLASLLCTVACSQRVWQTRRVHPAQMRPGEVRAFLKAHLYDGHVYVFDRWWVSRPRGLVGGRGLHYDERRNFLARGTFSVRLADVALLETTEPHRVLHAGPIVLGIVTTASVIVTSICIGSPKTCFGSCPTFYVEGENGPILDAEGFSASVARIYEETDVDSLSGAALPQDGEAFVLTMRNEALESHYVRSVHLLAAPRSEGERVLRAGRDYFPVGDLAPPSRCTADADDCTEAVATLDDRAYTTPTDPDDLGAQQVIELEYDVGPGPKGLVVSARNTLVGTFLFYQLLAWLGTSAGDVMRLIETGDPMADRTLRAGRELGRIRIEVLADDGAWTFAGVYDEVGPIASDRQVVPLPDVSRYGPVRVRLHVTRGYWRIDQLAAVMLGERVVPERLAPTRVERLVEGRWQVDDNARATLADSEARLATFPGQTYRLSFDLPADEHELFVESRGYYYEWMRESWLAEENAVEAARFMLDFRGSLRRLAPAYKRVEPTLEDLFFRSRIREVPHAW